MASFSARVDHPNPFVLHRYGWIRLVAKRPGGEAYADCRYEVVAGKSKVKDVTGPDGLILARILRGEPEAEIKLWDKCLPEDADPIEWTLELDDRPPVTEVAGVQWRLENLGFDCGGEYGSEGPKTRAAVRAFEEWVGLESVRTQFEATGAVTEESPISDPVRKALDDLYQRKAGLDHCIEFEGDDEEPFPTP